MGAAGHAAILVLTMAVVTWALRFLPFVIFRKKTPSYILYLGKVLPFALMGMLVVYCLKDTNVKAAPYGIPELIAVICVILLQCWKRNSLVSILFGTIIYMLLIRVMI